MPAILADGSIQRRISNGLQVRIFGDADPETECDLWGTFVCLGDPGRSASHFGEGNSRERNVIRCDGHVPWMGLRTSETVLSGMREKEIIHDWPLTHVKKRRATWLGSDAYT